MKATFFANAKEKFTTSHRKENVKTYFNSYKAIVLRPEGGYFTAVDLRLYYTGTTMYACVWYNNGSEIYGSASGKAGGYGYHLGSAAFADALRNSRFSFDEQISGVGETAIVGAIQAMCEAMNLGKSMIINTYA